MRLGSNVSPSCVLRSLRPISIRLETSRIPTSGKARGIERLRDLH